MQVNKNYDLANDYFIETTKISSIENICNKSFFFIMIVLYTIVSSKSSDDKPLSNIIFYISLAEISAIHAQEIFSFISDLPNYRLSRSVIKNIIDNGNISNESDGFGFDIKTLEIKGIKSCNPLFKKDSIILQNDSVLYGTNGIGKTSLVKKIFDQSFSQNILINNEILNLDYNHFKNNIIYLSSTTNLSLANYSRLFKSEYRKEIINILKEVGIGNNFHENMSSGEKQILAFLFLLCEKNKIIIIDESLSNVELKNKALLLSKIKKIITKNNFVITISHDKNVRNYFERKVNLNE